MTKKVFTTSAVSIMMLTGLLAPSASAVIPMQASETEIATSVAESSDEMVAAVGEADAVKENAPAQQNEPKTGMTREEKKLNAETNDPSGIGITLIAMSIVLSALAVLSILFFFFGKISSALLTKKKQSTIGATSTEKSNSKDLESGEVIAAIGMALAEHLHSAGHDMERTILTLRRMKRAYSPWNSKIYNIRHVPEQPVSKNKL